MVLPPRKYATVHTHIHTESFGFKYLPLGNKKNCCKIDTYLIYLLVIYLRGRKSRGALNPSKLKKYKKAKKKSLNRNPYFATSLNATVIFSVYIYSYVFYF